MGRRRQSRTHSGKESGADGFHRDTRVFEMKSVPPLKGQTVVKEALLAVVGREMV